MNLYAEPLEWFPADAERLLFAHRAIDLVAHLTSNTCRLECPHDTAECGYFVGPADPIKTTMPVKRHRAVRK